MSFNPLVTTPEKRSEIVEGYMDALNDRPSRVTSSEAYVHGYSVGTNDREGRASDYQIELAKRFLAASESGAACS
jgi:hypothetical protein